MSHPDLPVSTANSSHDEEVGDNFIYPGYDQIARFYGKRGMKMLNKFYRDCCRGQPLTDDQASMDLKQGLTFNLAENLCRGSQVVQMAAAQKIYSQATCFRQYGHH